jgi:MerR family transcriptional regulator, heat shock protein HspR
VSGEGGAPPEHGSRVEQSIQLPSGGAPLFTVSQVADILDLQPAFLRRLDAQEVVMPARSAGGQRRYSHSDINHIAALVAIMGEGTTLAGAQRIIELENEVARLRAQLRRRPATEGRSK